MKYENDQMMRIDGDLILNGSAGFNPCVDIASVAWSTQP